MFRFSVMSFVLMLTACSSTPDYTSLPLSTASLDIVSLNEQVNSRKGRHKVDARFTYAIENFNTTDNLYDCTVQFVTTSGGFLTQREGRFSQTCDVDAATGELSVLWVTPQDKAWDVAQQGFTRLMNPTIFFVALHQRVNNQDIAFIARSGCYALAGGKMAPVEVDGPAICASDEVGLGVPITMHSERVWKR